MIFLLLISALAFGAPLEDETQFKALHYERDLKTNTLKGKGNAWLKQTDQEIWADEILVDFAADRAFASGNVRIKRVGADMYATRAEYGLKTGDGVLEEGVIVMGTTVISGAKIIRHSHDRFELESGFYTNCNIELINDKSAATCPYSWKISGGRMSITIECYAQIHDAIVYGQDLPILYTPYFLMPAKSKRTSGLLRVLFGTDNALGSFIQAPVYFVLGDWHDTTITPTKYSKAGWHFGTEYRYIYSPYKYGNVKFNFTDFQYGSEKADPFVSRTDPTKSKGAKTLGLIGETFLDASNVYYLGRRSHTRQQIRLVSDPYYFAQFPSELKGAGGYLRSQVGFTFPTDRTLTTVSSQYFQSLIVPEDHQGGVDGGTVLQLPKASFSLRNNNVLSRYLTAEVDTRVANFIRPGPGYDNVPPTRTSPVPSLDNDFAFDSNDYIRTGRRLQVEPRFVFNVPMPTGLQLQPLAKVGALVYQFDYPQTEVLHREYADVELPFSLRFQKRFDTDFAGFEKLAHIFQPRLIYASSVYRSEESPHPFFFRGNPSIPESFSNPRFDALDFGFEYEYARYELINRFVRRTPDNAVQRFWLIQLSQQINSRVNEFESRINKLSRFSKHFGPLEFLTQVDLAPISVQFEANYQVETTPNVHTLQDMHEASWSGTITYDTGVGDLIKFNTRSTRLADPNANEDYFRLGGFKHLPTFFDIFGSLEYDAHQGSMGAYEWGFHISRKPIGCWSIRITNGKRRDGVQYAFFTFNMLLGAPSEFNTQYKGM